MPTDYVDKNRKFYDQWLFEKDEEKAVGWMQKHSQRLGFVELAQVIQHPPFEGGAPLEILDVGCGLGAFYDFLKTRPLSFNYTGWDLHPETVKRALEKRPDVRFEVRDLLKADGKESFDYVFASGAFSVNIVPKGESEEIQLQYVKKALSRMYQLCRLGCAASFLSSYGQGAVVDPHLFFYRPEHLLSIARTLNSKVVLNHDWRPDAFSIFIFKNTSRIFSEKGKHSSEAEMNWLLRNGLYQAVVDCYPEEGLTTAVEYSYRGAALLNLRQVGEARQLLQKALSLSDKDETIYLNLGACDYAEKKFGSALCHLQKAQALEPNNPYTNRLIQFLQNELKKSGNFC